MARHGLRRVVPNGETCLAIATGVLEDFAGLHCLDSAARPLFAGRGRSFGQRLPPFRGSACQPIHPAPDAKAPRPRPGLAWPETLLGGLCPQDHELAQTKPDQRHGDPCPTRSRRISCSFATSLPMQR